MTGCTTAVPLISVVIETFTVSREYPREQANSQIASALDRLAGQRYARDKVEVIVVVCQRNDSLKAFVLHQYPAVRVVSTNRESYLSMKNCGFEAARGEVVALLDADCIPVANWLERIASGYNRGADVIAGKTRYRPEHTFAGTFSVFDFGHVQSDNQGRAFAFNVNNVAFRRRIVARHRFDDRVRRNGGCFLFWRTLKLANCNMIYDPEMFAGHGNDFVGAGFIHKHVERGFDTINLFRIAAPELLPAARFMRLGPLVPIGMLISRLWFDARRIVLNRRDLSIRLYALPYYYAVSLVVRTLEAFGGMIAVFKPNYFGVD